jgi:hypothetical protein
MLASIPPPRKQTPQNSLSTPLRGEFVGVRLLWALHHCYIYTWCVHVYYMYGVYTYIIYTVCIRFFSKEITLRTVIYGVNARFWPTLHMLCVYIVQCTSYSSYCDR